jgi:hypothetical protein
VRNNFGGKMPSFGAIAQQARDGAKIQYPSDHKLGMRVPKGGSDCAKCEYVNGQNCTNKIFVRWNGGSSTIPSPIDEYCCDFFEPKED